MEDNNQKPITTAGAIVAEAVSQPTEAEKELEARRAQLRGLRIKSTTEVRPEEPTLWLDGVGFFAKDDIHAVKGKQKCGKTTALKVCAAAWMQGQHLRLTSGAEAARVLFLDTEQKQADVKLIVTDVMRMTALSAGYVDEHLAVYALRRRDFQLLLDDMKLLVSDFRPDVVIIDGIVEFVASFNDESLAKQLIRELLALCEDSHTAIVCVLHTNKADEDHNMRGHLGTMLAQKAGTVVECKKQGSVINVSCADARHQEMPEWNVMFGDDGSIVDADDVMHRQREQHRAELQQRRQEASEQKQRERLDVCLRIISNNGGYIQRKDLVTEMEKLTRLDRTTISKFLSQQIKNRTIFESGKTITASEETVIPF